MAFDIFNDTRMFEMKPEDRAPVIQTYFDRKYSNDPRVLAMQPEELAAVRDTYTQQALKAVDYFQAPPEQRGFATNIASKLWGGVGEAVQATGGGIQLLDKGGFKDEGSVADVVGKAVRNAGEYISGTSFASPTQPELRGERSTVGQGWDSFIGSTPGSMTPWAVGAGATALAATNPLTLPVAPLIGVVAGTTALALSFGGGTAKMKYDEAIIRGVPHEVAMREAGVQGMAEAIPEWIGDAVLYKVLGKGGTIVKGGINATINEVKNVGLKEFGSMLMKTMPTELTGELATTYTQLKSDERMGYPKQDMESALAVTAISTVFMSLGFGAGGFGLSKAKQDSFYKALNLPIVEGMDEDQKSKIKEIRSTVATTLSNRIAEGTGNEEFAQSWLNGANLAIEAGTPIDFSTKLVDFASDQMAADTNNDPMSTPYVDELMRKNGIDPDSGRFLGRGEEVKPVTMDEIMPGSETEFGQIARDYVKGIEPKDPVVTKQNRVRELESWEEEHRKYVEGITEREEKEIKEFKDQQTEIAAENLTVAEQEAAYQEYVTKKNDPKYNADIRAKKLAAQEEERRALEGKRREAEDARARDTGLGIYREGKEEEAAKRVSRETQQFMDKYGISQDELAEPTKIGAEPAAVIEPVAPTKPLSIADKRREAKRKAAEGITVVPFVPPKAATLAERRATQIAYVGGQAVSPSPESLIAPTEEELLTAEPAKKLVSKNLAPDMPQEKEKHPLVSAIISGDMDAIRTHLSDFSDDKLADTPERLANTHTNTLLLAAKNAVASLPPDQRGKALPRIANTIAKANELFISKAGAVQTGLIWKLKDDILTTEFKKDEKSPLIKYAILRGYEIKKGDTVPTPTKGKSIYHGEDGSVGNIVAKVGADNRELQIAFEKEMGIKGAPSTQKIKTGKKQASKIFGNEFAAQIAEEKGKVPLKKRELEKERIEKGFIPEKRTKEGEEPTREEVGVKVEKVEKEAKVVKETGKGIRAVGEKEINRKQEEIMVARKGSISSLELDEIKVGTPIIYEVDGTIIYSKIRPEDIGGPDEVMVKDKKGKEVKASIIKKKINEEIKDTEDALVCVRKGKKTKGGGK